MLRRGKCCNKLSNSFEKCGWIQYQCSPCQCQAKASSTAHISMGGKGLAVCNFYLHFPLSPYLHAQKICLTSLNFYWSTHVAVWIQSCLPVVKLHSCMHFNFNKKHWESGKSLVEQIIIWVTPMLCLLLCCTTKSPSSLSLFPGGGTLAHKTPQQNLRSVLGGLFSWNV